MSLVWLVTGSSRGLGRAIAEAALDAGHRVVATARTPSQLADLVGKYGDRVLPVKLDVTVAAEAKAAVAAGVERFGRIDVVVNNAGYGNMAAIEEVDMTDFRAQMEANFYGVVNVTRAVIPVMRTQKSGHILQVSSIGGRIGAPGLSAYQSAKWAVEGFSEVLAKEVAPFGVKVTLIEPGGFRTDWGGSSMTIAPVSEAYRASVGQIVGYREKTNGKEPGDPKKGAQAILRLVALAEPPLRLLLGSDAYGIAKAADEAERAADEKWKELSLSTDFADAKQGPDDYPWEKR